MPSQPQSSAQTSTSQSPVAARAKSGRAGRAGAQNGKDRADRPNRCGLCDGQDGRGEPNRCGLCDKQDGRGGRGGMQATGGAGEVHGKVCWVAFIQYICNLLLFIILCSLIVPLQGSHRFDSRAPAISAAGTGRRFTPRAAP